MAGAVFYTCWDALARAGVCRWQTGDPAWEPRLLLPLARRRGELPPRWLEASVADPLLPRLVALPAVAQALEQEPP
jgi:hypothetical protein